LDWNAFIRVYLQVPKKSLNTFIIKYVKENVAIVLFDDYYYLYDFVKEKKLKRLEEIRIEEGPIADEPRCN